MCTIIMYTVQADCNRAVSFVVCLNEVNAQTMRFLQRYNLPWLLNQKEFLNFGNLKGWKFRKLKREKHTYVQWHS